MDRYELFSFSCCLIAVTILVIFARRIGRMFMDLARFVGLAFATWRDEREADEKWRRERGERR